LLQNQILLGPEKLKSFTSSTLAAAAFCHAIAAIKTQFVQGEFRVESLGFGKERL